MCLSTLATQKQLLRNDESRRNHGGEAVWLCDGGIVQGAPRAAVVVGRWFGVVMWHRAPISTQLVTVGTNRVRPPVDDTARPPVDDTARPPVDDTPRPPVDDTCYSIQSDRTSGDRSLLWPRREHHHLSL